MTRAARSPTFVCATRWHRGTEGGWTTYLPTGEVMTVYDASLNYKQDGFTADRFGGKGLWYGRFAGQAAKGTLLQVSKW